MSLRLAGGVSRITLKRPPKSLGFLASPPQPRTRSRANDRNRTRFMAHLLWKKGHGDLTHRQAHATLGAGDLPAGGRTFFSNTVYGCRKATFCEEVRAVGVWL